MPGSRVQHGEAVIIRCAYGDTVLYPIAEVSMEVAGHPEAAVSETLPVSVLLGTDTPELAERSSGENEKAFVAVTRATSCKQKPAENFCEVQEKVSGEEVATLAGLEGLDEELFGVSKVKVRKTKKEKRAERQRREQLQAEVVREVDIEEGLEAVCKHERQGR